MERFCRKIQPALCARGDRGPFTGVRESFEVRHDYGNAEKSCVRASLQAPGLLYSHLKSEKISGRIPRRFRFRRDYSRKPVRARLPPEGGSTTDKVLSNSLSVNSDRRSRDCPCCVASTRMMGLAIRWLRLKTSVLGRTRRRPKSARRADFAASSGRPSDSTPMER